MPVEDTAKPMSNAAYRVMVWSMALMDFVNPAGRAERLLTRVPLKEGMVVVDYACGPGRYTIPAAGIVGPKGRMYAVDIQPLALEIVNRKASQKGLTNVEAVLANSYSTPIPDGIADLVLVIDAIHMMRDRIALFQEVHRLLKKDGLLFVDIHHTSVSAVRTQIEGTRLFKPVKLDGKTMILSRI